MPGSAYEGVEGSELLMLICVETERICERALYHMATLQPKAGYRSIAVNVYGNLMSRRRMVEREMRGEVSCSASDPAYRPGYYTLWR